MRLSQIDTEEIRLWCINDEWLFAHAESMTRRDIKRYISNCMKGTPPRVPIERTYLALRKQFDAHTPTPYGPPIFPYKYISP